MPEPAAEEPENGGIWNTLKKALLMYIGMTLVMRVVGNYTGGNSSNTAVASNNGSNFNGVISYNNIDYDHLEFSVLEKPIITERVRTEYTTISHENGTESVIEQEIPVIDFKEAIYNNSELEPKFYYPMWKPSPQDSYNLLVYINDEPSFDPVSEEWLKEPVFTVKDFDLSQSYKFSKHIEFEVSELVGQKNGSIYLHTFLSKLSEGGDELDYLHNPDVTSHGVFPVTIYQKKNKEIKLHKLIGNDEPEQEEVEVPDSVEQPIIAYYHQNITLSILETQGTLNVFQTPPSLQEIIQKDPLNRRDNATGAVIQYYPIIYQNKFWQLKEHFNEINNTLSTIGFDFVLESSAWWKIQGLTVLNEGFTQQAAMLGGDGASEIDSVKRILLETNIYLLVITGFVTLLHSLLEFLAFKNDISHWRNKKDNVGISVRTIIANVVMQTIILLYLIDNSDGTSLMIFMSQGAGILIEAWKITTVVKISLVPTTSGLLPYTLLVEDKYQLSETEKKTQEYDSIAFKYLYIASVPLVLAYSYYSLVYKTHKSWYSFIITTLVGCVYTYGFLMLVPAIYINYRLKSVAHMPSKAMAYKVVNTFIDDLFAFVIKMPWLHRLATLRDDVIFVIYLYQTWIYKVDLTRVNEYGQGGDDEGENSVEKKNK